MTPSAIYGTRSYISGQTTILILATHVPSLIPNATRRLEPYLNVPSPSLENADSPPGPLQNNLKEPELTDWRTIDWAAVIAATPVQEANTSNEGVSWTTAVATEFDDSFDDALNDIGRDFGGYGLLCLLPCFIAFGLRLRLLCECTCFSKDTTDWFVGR